MNYDMENNNYEEPAMTELNLQQNGNSKDYMEDAKN